MKGQKRKSVLIVIPIILAFILGLNLLLLLFDSCTSEKYTKRYHDVEIYLQQKYRDKEEYGSKIYSSGGNANLFLPEYKELKYNYSDMDFYIFDGTGTMTYTAVTFVLDLKFSDKNEYEAAKQNELSTRSFRTEYEGKRWLEKDPVFEFNLDNFFCKTVLNNDYPRRFGLICFNDSYYVLRYLYFEEWESPEYIKDKDYILKCTSCPWGNDSV